MAPKILTGQEFDFEISLNIVTEVIDVDELDEGYLISAAAGKESN